MDKKTFEALVKKYLAGKATEEEKALLDAWYDRFEEDAVPEMDEATARETGAALYERIRQQQGGKVRMLYWLRMAAMWVLLAGAGGVLYTQRHAVLDALDPVKQRSLTAAKGEVKRVTLADGTEVWLNSGSTLYFPEEFRRGNREVKLEGEAYFNVRQQPEQPFVVYAGVVKTEVLGTSFNVRSYAALGEVKVAVTSGKVAVSAEKLKAVTLQPNQQAVYHKQSSSIQKEDMDAGAAAGWMKGSWVFRDAPLAEIAVALENRFKVSIRIAGHALAAKRMTASFAAEDSLQLVLDNLRETAGLHYRFDKPDEIILY